MGELDDVLKTLNQLKDDLDDDFKWLEAVRKIRRLSDDFPLTFATQTVGELFDLCDQIIGEYPTNDVMEIRNQILKHPSVKGLIKTILYRKNVPNRDDAEQTVYQLLLESLERGLPYLTPGYIRLKVKEALGSSNYKQVYAECLRQVKREINQHRAEYERICKETKQELTESGFDKYLDQWCKDLASEIVNNPDRIGPDEEEGEIDPRATEPPDDLEESELEDFHAKVKEALMSVPRVPPARLIHIFYQVYVLGKDQNDVASEIGYDEATVSRDLDPRIKDAIESISIIKEKDCGYNLKEMQGYFPWLRDCLPSSICFAHPNDLKYLIKCVKRKEGGEVMWKVYDWFRKNWCLLQSSQNFHIDINERWYMDVGIDIDDESAEITRVTLKSEFWKEGQLC